MSQFDLKGCKSQIINKFDTLLVLSSLEAQQPQHLQLFFSFLTLPLGDMQIDVKVYSSAQCAGVSFFYHAQGRACGFAKSCSQTCNATRTSGATMSVTDYWASR